MLFPRAVGRGASKPMCRASKPMCRASALQAFHARLALACIGVGVGVGVGMGGRVGARV